MLGDFAHELYESLCILCVNPLSDHMMYKYCLRFGTGYLLIMLLVSFARIHSFIHKVEHLPCAGFLLFPSEVKINNKWSLPHNCLWTKAGQIFGLSNEIIWQMLSWSYGGGIIGKLISFVSKMKKQGRLHRMKNVWPESNN